jgi:hypothetical protein
MISTTRENEGPAHLSVSAAPLSPQASERYQARPAIRTQPARGVGVDVAELGDVLVPARGKLTLGRGILWPCCSRRLQPRSRRTPEAPLIPAQRARCRAAHGTVCLRRSSETSNTGCSSEWMEERRQIGAWCGPCVPDTYRQPLLKGGCDCCRRLAALSIARSGPT